MIVNKYFSDGELETIISCENLIEKCKMIVDRLFKGKVDKGGKPYVGHLYRVSERLDTEYEKCAGLLHDTLEDIEGMTAEELLYLGIPQQVIDIVLLVTKTEGVSYSDEIDNIIASGNTSAIKLKVADMSDNMKPERLNMTTPEFRAHAIKKYTPQLVKLKGALEQVK